MKNIILMCLVFVTLSCANTQENKDEKEIVTKEVVEETPKRVEATEIESNGSFEGKITYELTMQAKGDPKDYKTLKKVFGDTAVFTFSKGRYSMEYPAGRIEYIKYLRDNYQYRKMVLLDTLYFSNMGLENNNLYSSIREKTDTEILGRKVDMVNLVTNKYKKTYYFDPNMYMNPEYFKKHRYGYENKYYQLAKAPYLYAEFEYDKLRIILKAIKIEEMKIPEEFFTLPNLTNKADNIGG